ncbi:MAG: hypothetical protein WDM76_10245 [Limisphaerales bacterium]
MIPAKEITAATTVDILGAKTDEQKSVEEKTEALDKIEAEKIRRRKSRAGN